MTTPSAVVRRRARERYRSASSHCARSVAARPTAPRRLRTSHSRRLLRDVLEMVVAEEHGRCRLGAPAGKPRESVGRVADQRQPVGDGRRVHAPLGQHARIVVDDPAPPVEEDDAIVLDELGHVLVRRADEDPLDPRDRRRTVRTRRRSRRRPRTRPSARGLSRAPRSRPPRSGTGRAARAASRPTTCSRDRGRCGRFDHPVGRAADVRRTLLAEQVEQLVDEPGHAGQVRRRRARGPAAAARNAPGTARRWHRPGGGA